eukprot:767568-Pleurochrysis_carterae.AAC.3
MPINDRQRVHKQYAGSSNKSVCAFALKVSLGCSTEPCWLHSSVRSLASASFEAACSLVAAGFANGCTTVTRRREMSWLSEMRRSTEPYARFRCCERGVGRHSSITSAARVEQEAKCEPSPRSLLSALWPDVAKSTKQSR